jgi:glycosyltransferase involved in cell wall biosynthesis
MNISIVIASYNQSQTFERCLVSLLSTEYEYKYEIVIVDSSKDPHREIISSIVDKYTALGHTNIRFIRLPKQTYCGHARNIGISHANYDYIAMTDTDCEVDKNWLTVAQKHMRPKIFLNGVIENGTPQNLFGTSLYLFEFSKYIHLKQEMIFHSKEGFGAQMIFHKSALNMTGQFEPVYDDTIFTKKFHQQGGCIIQLKNMRVKHNNETNYRKVMRKCYNIGLHSAVMRKKYDLLPKPIKRIPILAFLLTFFRFFTTLYNVAFTPHMTSLIKTSPLILINALMWSWGFYHGIVNDNEQFYKSFK